MKEEIKNPETSVEYTMWKKMWKNMLKNMWKKWCRNNSR